MVYNIIVSVVLAASVGLTCWTANKVVTLSELVSALKTQADINTGRIDSIEKFGSRTLDSHITSDDARVADIKVRIDKLENAVLSLQSIPGDLKAINVQLDAFRESLSRIESNTRSENLDMKRKP